MNKKILFALIPVIFLGFFGSLKIGSAAPASAVVALDPVVSCEVVGNDLSVDVKISNVANLYFWEFQAFYETDCLDAINVVEGAFLKSFADSHGTHFAVLQINDAYNSTHGFVWAYCLMNGEPSQPATGNGVLATIKFRGTAGGMSHIFLAFPGSAYPVDLKDRHANVIPCTTTAGVDALIIGPESVPLDIDIDVGALYFAGEQVEFYILTTYRGVSVTPTYISAKLYNPDGESVSLNPQVISTGFYKVTYTMPLDASSGTWAIVVEATHLTDAIQTHGTSFKTYLFSSTLDSLQARVISIQGSTATIQTSLGTIQGTITSINNNIATIQTNIGIIRTDISTIKANTTPTTDWTTIGLYISLAFLVSIAIVLVVLYLYLRARFPAETAQS